MLVIHNHANATQSVQDYCGPNWQAFFMDATLFDSSFPFNSVSELVFDPTDIDSLMRHTRAVTQITSNVVNGVLTFTHGSSLVTMRQNGRAVQEQSQGSTPLYSVGVINAVSGGSRATLSLAEKLSLLNDDNVGISFPLNAGIQTLSLECLSASVKYVEIEFGAQIPTFNIASVAPGGTQTHTKTLVGTGRYLIDNSRVDTTAIILSFDASQTIFEIRAIRLFTDEEIVSVPMSLDYCILRPMAHNASVLIANAPIPYFVVDCAGPLSEATMRLNKGGYIAGEPVTLMHCQFKPQFMEV